MLQKWKGKMLSVKSNNSQSVADTRIPIFAINNLGVVAAAVFNT